jgi:hypothetical protein
MRGAGISADEEIRARDRRGEFGEGCLGQRVKARVGRHAARIERRRELAGRLEKADQAPAKTAAAEVAEKVRELAKREPSGHAYELARAIKAVEAAAVAIGRPLLDEPPLRGNSQMVYDSKNKLIVLFGGNRQDARLNDTWVYDVRTRTWAERFPEPSPPPTDVIGATYVSRHGLVFAVGFRVPSRPPAYGAWTYDAAANVWTPINGQYAVARRPVAWSSAAYSTKDDVVLLYAANHQEATFAYRLDPATAKTKRKGFKPGAVWPRINWDARTAKLPSPDPEAHAKKLAELPVNRWVKMPGPHVYRKTWGSATVDTDRGVILYYGGGHSGYSGTDVAHYDVGTGRWSLSYPPKFPPFLEGTNLCPFGWGYDLQFWTEHTRKWYAYDPVSKMMVYARLGGFGPGRTAYLTENGTESFKAKGYVTWVYNPTLRKWYAPTFEQPFSVKWSGRLVTTHEGIYAHVGGTVWKCTVENAGTDEVPRYVGKWSVYGKTGGTGGEFDATVYDSKRHRLVILTGAGRKPAMTCFDLKTKKTTRPSPKGVWDHNREACYIPTQDVILTPAGYRKTGYCVYRCADNEWVRPTITQPKSNPGPAATGPDTTTVYDPVHDVLFYFDVQNTVYLMRYDDNRAQIRNSR